MKKIAIIPARSGSKGLKDKNIKMLNNKPLIAYSIEAALDSKLFDKVIVSTDSKKYAEISKRYGAEVPFLRDEALANDTASTWDVVKDVLNKYKEQGVIFEDVVLLQPTSPLRSYKDIVDGYNFYIEKEANFVVGVSEVEHSPLWANTLPEDLSMKNFIKNEVSNVGRQKLEPYYRINGGLYIIKAEYLFNTNNIYGHRSFAYKMDKLKAIDIDDDFDFYIAECLMKKIKD